MAMGDELTHEVSLAKYLASLPQMMKRPREAIDRNGFGSSSEPVTVDRGRISFNLVQEKLPQLFAD